LWFEFAGVIPLIETSVAPKGKNPSFVYKNYHGMVILTRPHGTACNENIEITTQIAGTGNLFCGFFLFMLRK
jgi:hypothetical protein